MHLALDMEFLMELHFKNQHKKGKLCKYKQYGKQTISTNIPNNRQVLSQKYRSDSESEKKKQISDVLTKKTVIMYF